MTPQIIGFILFIIGLFIARNVKNVKQGEVGLIETLGKYTRTEQPGLIFLLPGLQSIRRVDIREQVIAVPEQHIITKDNVGITVDGIVYVQIIDAPRAMYEISNVLMAVVSLAQTNLRSVLGTMSLDETFANRSVINTKLLESLDRETNKWGVKVMRVEIKRLDPPVDIQTAMSKQMKAEREKRAQILEAEGYKQALITKTEGDKESQILHSEALRQSRILEAEGDAQATILRAEASAKKIEIESSAAQQYFSGGAVVKEQLNVLEASLKHNTKYVLDSSFLDALSSIMGKK
jgi:regulator of protease activity HflC (stomatin/prohibitin superfamily)